MRVGLRPALIPHDGPPHPSLLTPHLQPRELRILPWGTQGLHVSPELGPPRTCSSMPTRSIEEEHEEKLFCDSQLVYVVHMLYMLPILVAHHVKKYFKTNKNITLKLQFQKIYIRKLGVNLKRLSLKKQDLPKKGQVC